MALLGKALAWFTGHARLVIEYILIGLLVSVSGYALWQWGHSHQQDTQIATLAGSLNTLSATSTQTINSLVQSNADQDAAIASLKDLREKDAKAIAGLQKDVVHAAVSRESVSKKLELLEKNNAQAKKLLDTAVPADTSCVLDRRPCPTPSGHEDGN
jgi:uncharacterized membrane protein affecting hemolysin expression